MEGLKKGKIEKMEKRKKEKNSKRDFPHETKVTIIIDQSRFKYYIHQCCELKMTCYKD